MANPGDQFIQDVNDDIDRFMDAIAGLDKPSPAEAVCLALDDWMAAAAAYGGHDPKTLPYWEKVSAAMRRYRLWRW